LLRGAKRADGHFGRVIDVVGFESSSWQIQFSMVVGCAWGHIGQARTGKKPTTTLAVRS
jgi:hypothetical protein